MYRLDLHLAQGIGNENVTRSLRKTLDPFRGGKTAIRIHYTTAAGVSGVINLGKNWCVTPAQRLVEALQEMLGKENIAYQYNREALFNLIPKKQNHRTREAVNH